MNPVDLESALERLLAETPPLRASQQRRADMASATSRQRQRPRWLTSLKEPPMRYHSQVVVGSPTLRLAAVVAATAALTLGIAGAVVMGASPEPMPPDTVAPTWVTGRVSPAASCKDPGPVVDGDVLRSRGVECSPQTWTSSDPRLSGTVSRRWNSDVHQTDEGMISVGMDAAYLTNEEGGWACSASYVERGYGMSAEAVAASHTFTCSGDGGYAGLSAILVLEAAGGFSEDIVGLIFAGDLPPVPEKPAAE